MSIRSMQVTWTVVVLALEASIVWFTMRVVAASPGFSDMGESILSEVALLCTVALLACVGIVHRLARPTNRFGWLLILVACLLLTTEWDIPGAAAAGALSAAVFSIGLLLTIAVPVAATWVVLAFPSGRVDGRVERYLLIAGALVFVGALGLVPALFSDPQAQGCSDCPTNLLLARDDPDVAMTLSRPAMTAALAWATITMVVLLLGLARMSPASRRARGAVWMIGLVYLVAVSAQLLLSLDRGFVGGSMTDHGPWWVQLAALAALALAVAFSLLRARAMRRSVTGLVVDLHREAAAGGMREALAEWLHDPSLQVAYPVDGTYRDVDLAAVDVTDRPGRATSRLVEDGQEIAVLVHRPGLFDSPDAVREVVTAARLGLENERLRAEGLAQLHALADSRVRIIEAGDRERRRLERDLHDGAQQRLVGLLLGLRLLRTTTGEDHGEVDEAEAEIQATVDDLRELANGLHPVVLLTEGFAGACAALSESMDVRVVDAPERRFSAVVETTAYLLAAKAATAGPTTVYAVHDGDALRVHVDVAAAGIGLAGLEDRVNALGGHLEVSPDDKGLRIELELPLAAPAVSRESSPGTVPRGDLRTGRD
ncbi:sensor histidine kinase [Terrabacter sp. GCM10028922]|uniref:sensor histidine kinase n=1 Tax=Terrabacter sp. GCM10028922 TaxID=3273428 RepID=UPI0036180E99